MDLIFKKGKKIKIIENIEEEIDLDTGLGMGEFVILEEITCRCLGDLEIVRQKLGANWKVDKVENIISEMGLLKKIYLIPA